MFRRSQSHAYMLSIDLSLSIIHYLHKDLKILSHLFEYDYGDCMRDAVVKATLFIPEAAVLMHARIHRLNLAMAEIGGWLVEVWGATCGLGKAAWDIVSTLGVGGARGCM